MHFFSLFGPTFNINTSSSNETREQVSNPAPVGIQNNQRTPTQNLTGSNSLSNILPMEVQNVLQTILPNLGTTPQNVGNNESPVQTPTNNPNNSIIMLYEDLGAQQASGLTLTDIHEISQLLLNEKTEENEEVKICSICQQNIEWDTIIRRINTCEHEYHVNCIDQWLVDHTSCPTCRRELGPGIPEGTSRTNEQNVSSYQFRVPLRNSS